MTTTSSLVGYKKSAVSGVGCYGPTPKISFIVLVA
jgi:hypothetical protein